MKYGQKTINAVTCLESESELYEFVYKGTAACGGLITLEDQGLTLFYVSLHSLLAHAQNAFLLVKRE